MKYTYNETTEKEIEFSFPAFVRYFKVYYKLFEDKSVIKVNDYAFSYGIEINNINYLGVIFGNAGWEFIKEEEFNEAYQSVSEKIMKYLPQPELNEKRNKLKEI